MLRLDYLSCVLTVLSTVLVGKKLWQGWVIAGANSVVICIIGMRTAQFGFVPANLFCIGLYANNLWSWRSKGVAATSPRNFWYQFRARVLREVSNDSATPVSQGTRQISCNRLNIVWLMDMLNAKLRSAR